MSQNTRATGSGAPSVLFTIPENRLKGQLFDTAGIDAINRRFDARWNPHNRELTREELLDAVRGMDAVVTAWGSLPLDDGVLEQADRLCFVGHTGGTIKWLVTEEFFRRGIPIVSANAALAPGISEYCLLMCLLASWDMLGTVATVRCGGWLANEDIADGLKGKSVGIIGYGIIAREFIRLLRPFQARVVVHSGHCGEVEAREQGFVLGRLEEALACDIVSLHATLTPKTENLLDAAKLALIRDGAIFINTARARLTEEEALMAELRTGRFTAVLDVFHQEPLPADHPLRRMKNVVCTPHIAGAHRYWRRKQAEIVVEDMERCFRGEEPLHLVTLDQYRRLTPR